jgi:hypothetical protein
MATVGGVKMPMNRGLALAVVLGALSMVACAMTSRVMDAGDGIYLISAHASAVRGGATGANTIAYDDAQKFCAEKGQGLHAIVVDAQERDVYQSSVGGAWGKSGGGFGGGSVAAGNVNFRFRCGQ